MLNEIIKMIELSKNTKGQDWRHNINQIKIKINEYAKEYHESNVKKLNIPDVMATLPTAMINRVEVIDENGRSYVNWKPIETAKELIEKFVNQPINFPYIDTEDCQCIGAGYMTYRSAKDCALIYVDGMIKEHTWKSSTSFEDAQKAKWESIKLALLSL